MKLVPVVFSTILFFSCAKPKVQQVQSATNNSSSSATTLSVDENIESLVNQISEVDKEMLITEFGEVTTHFLKNLDQFLPQVFSAILSDDSQQWTSLLESILQNATQASTLIERGTQLLEQIGQTQQGEQLRNQLIQHIDGIEFSVETLQYLENLLRGKATN